MIANDGCPTRFGRYRVDALIGEGSTGMVFRGVDEGSAGRGHQGRAAASC